MPKHTIFPPGSEPPPSGSGALLLIQPNPLVSLYAIDIPTEPPTKLRVTAYPSETADGISLHFERDSTGAAIPYYSCSIWHEETTSDTEGGIRKVQITIQNVTREGIALAETYNGLIGQKVRHVIVRRDELPDGTPRYEETFEILQATFSRTAGKITCGQTALTQAKFPGRRISRTHCQHRYGGAGCGYDTTRGGALQTCAFTLEDCTLHGLDEAAALLPNRHPARILLFPGVARSTGVDVR